MTMATSVIGEKAQITLPKAVREALKIQGKGERVGFILEGGKVVLTKAEVVPAGEEFTEAEWKALLRINREKGAKTYRSGKSFLRALRRITGV